MTRSGPRPRHGGRGQGDPAPLGPATPLGALVTDRLGALADRHSLSPHQLCQLERLLATLAADEHAPTTVSDPVRAVDVHLADSLAALEVSAVRDARTACDLGAGAGFPGLPLAVALPECEVFLVESATRKCRFLACLVETLQVHNATVVCARAEQWQAGAGRHDAAFARALAPAPVVIEYAAPLLRRGGELVDWRGSRNPEDEQRATAAASEVGLEFAGVRRIPPFPGGDQHHLHLYVKVGDTPARFPRRPGIARKRPLGASRCG